MTEPAEVELRLETAAVVEDGDVAGRRALWLPAWNSFEPLSPLALPGRDDERCGVGGVQRVEQRVDSRPKRGARVLGGQRGDQRELARAKSGRRAFGRRGRARALFSDFVEEVGGDRVRRIQAQRRAKRDDRLVPVALFEMAAAEARPGRDVARGLFGDGGVDASWLRRRSRLV